jgi:hypothetical protein
MLNTPDFANQPTILVVDYRYSDAKASLEHPGSGSA